MKAAVFCGTFDPFTLGHLDILKKATRIFDKVYVAVPLLQTKSMVSAENRIKIVRASIEGFENAEVVSFSGLLTDLCRALKCTQIVRGIRNPTDFVYENELLNNYKTQEPSIECTYFVPSQEVSHISSTIVRELAKFNGDLTKHVSIAALALIEQAYK